MKHESGYINKSRGIEANDRNNPGLIDQTISPVRGQEKSVSAESAIKGSGGGKAKVIPLRKEDINLSDSDAKKKRVMIVLVVLLSIVLGFIILRPQGKNLNAGQMPPKGGEQADKKVISKLQVARIWKVPEKISDGVRDITRDSKSKSEFSESSGRPELPVRGIVVYSDDKKSAIIGDMIVKVGDTINGVKIYMINTDSVVFEKDGLRWTGYVE